MVALKTEHEKEIGIKFSKRGIIDFIETQIVEDSIEKDQRWECKMKSPGLMYYIKKGGSDVNKNQPYMRTEITFAKPFKMDKIIKCIYDTQYQAKWDKNLKSSEKIDVLPGKNSFYIQYTLNKKVMTFDPRDFYEKGFSFAHNGTYYRYSTPIPNGNETKPPPKGTVRADSIICFGKISRNTETDQKVVFLANSQCDFKMKVPDFLINTFAPKAAKTYMNDVQKFYKKNHEEM